MNRRDLLRGATWALAGGIFVPTFERWFRPTRIIPASAVTLDDLHLITTFNPDVMAELIRADLAAWNDATARMLADYTRSAA